MGIADYFKPVDTMTTDGVRAFLDRHRYAKAGTDDLRAALESASGRDLRPYFERWIYDTGLPVIAWSASTTRAGGGVRSTFEVRPQELPGPLPLQLAATTADGREARVVLLEPSGGSWTIDTRGEPRRLEVNEDRGLLARVQRQRRPPQR